MSVHTIRPTDMSRTIQVIGCGMARTGTVSFGLACKRLVGGTVYHGGEAASGREEAHILRWLDIFKHMPCQNEVDRSYVRDGLREQLQGYTITCEYPCIRLVEEQMALYPDAKVICTIRDQESWWRSFKPLWELSSTAAMSIGLFWLPTLRYLALYVRGVERACYPDGFRDNGPGIYDEHIEYLRRVVPKEKLHFFSVKEGWEPLCKILDVPVPDEPFPRANDSAAMQAKIGAYIRKGLTVWALIIIAVGVVSGVLVRILY